MEHSDETRGGGKQGTYRGKAATPTSEKSHRARLALEVINPPLRVLAAVACNSPSWWRHSPASVRPTTCTNPLISRCNLTQVE